MGPLYCNYQRNFLILPGLPAANSQDFLQKATRHVSPKDRNTEWLVTVLSGR